MLYLTPQQILFIHYRLIETTGGIHGVRDLGALQAAVARPQATFDNNDLSTGIVAAAQNVTSYYIIGFYSTHAANDGKFRRIKVSLADGREGELAYRQGYYADKEWAKQNGVERERQLEEALMLENPVTDITIAMELNYFQLNRAEYFVPVAVKIPGPHYAIETRPRESAAALRPHLEALFS